MQKIGEKIRLFAKEKGFSLAELSKLLGMKPQSLNVYLNGKSLPGAEILMKLKKLGCDINWLLSEEEESNPPLETLSFLLNRLQELEQENEKLRATLSNLISLAQENLKKKKH
jgi:transcriptional regulator with XRE-family HTH domain